MKQKILTFSRYSIVSIATLFINLGLVWLCTEVFHFYYLISCTIGFLFANLLAFFCNRSWTFHSHVGFSRGSLLAIFVGILTLLSILILMYIFVEFLGIHYLLSRIIVALLAGVLSYILDSRITFGRTC